MWQHSSTDLAASSWAQGSPAFGQNLLDCASLNRQDHFLWSDRNCLELAIPLCHQGQMPFSTTTTTTTTTTTMGGGTTAPTGFCSGKDAGYYAPECCATTGIWK